MTGNPVLLVTGGASGIGKGIATLFASRGYSVVIADINQDAGEAVAEQLRQQGRDAAFVKTDIRNQASVQDLFQRLGQQFGRLDCLCNNAGIERYRSAEDYTLEEFNSITETNLRGAFLCTQSAFPLLKAGRGSIINIASIQGIATERHISVYAATKAGLLGWTRAIALDFAQHGIRANAVCPGAIQTGMLAAALADAPDPESMIAAMNGSIPLRRIGSPEDVAEAVYFLSSPAAAYITGTSIVVDGGLLARHAL